MDKFDLVGKRDRELKELEDFLTKVNNEVIARQSRIKLLNDLIAEEDEETKDEGLSE